MLIHRAPGNIMNHASLRESQTQTQNHRTDLRARVLFFEEGNLLMRASELVFLGLELLHLSCQDVLKTP